MKSLKDASLSVRLFAVLAGVASVASLVVLCRALGFSHGVLIGATPASGVALALCLILRWPGAAAAAIGFFLGDWLWAMPLEMAAVDAIAHSAAAAAGWQTMRALARRGAISSRTLAWLAFLVGAAVFSLVVASVFGLAANVGLLGADVVPLSVFLMALVFEPLGVATGCAVLVNIREARKVWDEPAPAIGIASLAIVLLAFLGLLLDVEHESLDPSAMTLLLAVPFCLWLAMQRRSFDGATISFVAVNIALVMVLGKTGSVAQTQFLATILFLNLLVLTSQLVHAINIDRLTALDENAGHRRDLEARVAERTERLRVMTERAIAADAAKSRFIATIAHEVRTPLTGVIGMTSVVLAGDLDEETRRNVGVIRSSGHHLLSVINRTLDFSKLDGGDFLEEDVEFDLKKLISDVVEEARFSTNSDDITIRTEEVGDLHPCFVGNRQALRQIVTNLVGNATKFTDEGEVVVRSRQITDGLLRIEVQDTGIGVPPAAQERIFLPFEQGDGSMTRRFGGTGLGLAICSEMVKRMGGRIGVRSAEGVGSIFWVEVPLAHAEPPGPPPGPPATKNLELVRLV